MTIHLPEELEQFVSEQVRAGRYRSEGEVVRDALERLRRITPFAEPSALGSIGSMREAADELDQIVSEALRRRQEPWRPLPGE